MKKALSIISVIALSAGICFARDKEQSPTQPVKISKLAGVIQTSFDGKTVNIKTGEDLPVMQTGGAFQVLSGMMELQIGSKIIRADSGAKFSASYVKDKFVVSVKPDSSPVQMQLNGNTVIFYYGSEVSMTPKKDTLVLKAEKGRYILTTETGNTTIVGEKDSKAIDMPKEGI